LAYLPLVFPLLSFAVWCLLFGHYSRIPVEDISLWAVYGVTCLDLLTTLGLYAASLCLLFSTPVRFDRSWFAAVLLLLVMAAGACAARFVSLGFGEPIHREVAAVMLSPYVYIYLPLIGLAIGAIVVLRRSVLR
jgi:hypothetical protein